MANSYLDRTPSSAGNSKTFTISCWIKRSKLGYNYDMFYTAGLHQSTLMSQLYFTNDDKLYFGTWLADGNSDHYIHTNRVFRDVNCWYHLCVAVDTTQATASNRVKIYVNGVQETDLNITNNYPAQNHDYAFNSTLIHNIGRRGDLASSYHEGYLSHVVMVDGTALAPTSFGSTDTTTGEWKIITSPSVTWGTNGFLILKDSASGTDQSTNSNNFTANGNLQNSEDCPSNVFCTMNPLDNYTQGSTFTNGNTKLEWNTNNRNNFSTLAMNKGKFYWEMKYVITSGGTNAMIGVSKFDTRQGDNYPGHDSTAWSYYAADGKKYHAGSDAAYGNTWAVDDIIGIAFNADTRTIWFSKNGTWQNSATISEIAAGTTTNSAYTGMGTAGEFFIPCMSAYDGNKAAFNFGNGYFSTTAISSEGTNASGIGKFEYDVPTGYTALSTKGLNE